MINYWQLWQMSSYKYISCLLPPLQYNYMWWVWSSKYNWFDNCNEGLLNQLNGMSFVIRILDSIDSAVNRKTTGCIPKRWPSRAAWWSGGIHLSWWIGWVLNFWDHWGQRTFKVEWIKIYIMTIQPMLAPKARIH